MTYELIDPTIQAWVEENGLTLFTSVDEREARYCFRSSPKGECFQISLEKPRSGHVKVHAWSIETIDDEELHQMWTVGVAELRSALDNALIQLDEWMNR